MMHSRVIPWHGWLLMLQCLGSLAREDAGMDQAADDTALWHLNKLARVSGGLTPYCPCQGIW
jgi:hypothetical protein